MKKKILTAVFCLLFAALYSQSKKDWEKVQELNSLSAYEKFIIQYPNGQYAEAALKNMLQLKEQEKSNLEKIEKRQENFRNLDKSNSTSEVIDKMFLTDYINSKRFNGFFESIDLISENTGKTPGYTGILIYENYFFGFDKGKLINWHLEEKSLGEGTFRGLYKNPDMGNSAITWNFSDKTIELTTETNFTTAIRSSFKTIKEL